MKTVEANLREHQEYYNGQSQVTQYTTVQPDPSHPVYSSARLKSPSIQPHPSHPVHSSAKANSPSIQFGQSKVNQYTVQSDPSNPQPEPSHPVYSHPVDGSAKV